MWFNSAENGVVVLLWRKVVLHFSCVLESSCAAVAEGSDRDVPYKCPLLPGLVRHLAKFMSPYSPPGTQ